MTTTRFAPSPTGLLHLGHAYSAMLAHDAARAAGGRFVLRIEDIDESRCRPEYAEAIYRDLEWLGLEWDGPVVIQSERADMYRSAVQTLAERGLAYRCWCTRTEIEAAAGAPHDGEPPAYPGTCRHSVQPVPDRPHCWRINVEDARAVLPTRLCVRTLENGVAMALPVRLGALNDFVIERKDALSSYMIACTIDDAEQGVTDIIRGDDLYPLIHGQRLLQELLGLPSPRYRHHPLIVGDDGKRLAKRDKAPTLAALRESGTDPAALMDRMRDGRFPVGFALQPA